MTGYAAALVRCSGGALHGPGASESRHPPPKPPPPPPPPPKPPPPSRRSRRPSSPRCPSTRSRWRSPPAPCRPAESPLVIWVSDSPTSPIVTSRVTRGASLHELHRRGRAHRRDRRVRELEDVAGDGDDDAHVGGHPVPDGARRVRQRDRHVVGDDVAHDRRRRRDRYDGSCHLGVGKRRKCHRRALTDGYRSRVRFGEARHHLKRGQVVDGDEADELDDEPVPTSRSPDEPVPTRLFPSRPGPGTCRTRCWTSSTQSSSPRRSRSDRPDR